MVLETTAVRGPTVLVAQVPSADYVPVVTHELASRTGVAPTDGDGSIVERIYMERARPLIVFSRDGSSRSHRLQCRRLYPALTPIGRGESGASDERAFAGGLARPR
jgi:hypothetical protein